MNRLLLLALFSACLIVITNGLEQVDEQSVAELDAEVAALREAREADPKKKNGKNEKKSKKERRMNKKARKGKKKNGNKKAKKANKKGKKSNKKTRKGNKKARKGNKKAKKGNKKSKKGNRKAKKGNKKTKKGNKKGRKGKKNKKGNKKTRKGKKNSRKEKKNRNKNAKNGKKSSRKTKKNRNKNAKKGKKNSRNGKKKGNKKTRKGKKQGNKKGARKVTSRATSCMNETCINNAMSYLNIMKLRVANFLIQKSRIEKYNSTSGKKAGKKGVFGPILNRIREAGGGNSSNLKCNGDNSSAGATQFANLTNLLIQCEGNINTSCNGNLPVINTTEHDLCNTAMTAFANLTATCLKVSGTEACTCWTSDALAFSVKAVKKCDISSDNKKMTAAKKKCVTAFGKCRKLEDEVSPALSACSPLNSKSRAIADIKQGLKNKAAASKLSAKCNATANANATSRATITMTCAIFTAVVSKAKESMLMAPLLVGVETQFAAIIAATVGSCSATEKTALLAVSIEVDRTALNIDLNIDSKQSDLLISTGTTVSIAAVSATITDSATTVAADATAAATDAATDAATAGATTKSSSRRHRKMFKASNMKMW